MSFKNTLLPVATSLQSQGRLLSLEKPVVMGILNATPDSFYTHAGNNSITKDLLELAEKMLNDGAVILDIGGASTRPGAEEVCVDEELRRVIPVIETLTRTFPDVWLSVDTYYGRVAKEAVAAGAAIINDISAGDMDPAMTGAAAALQVPYIAMHMQGAPRTMQDDPQYDDVVREVFEYLRNKVQACAALGIHDLVLDPGFGFGKTVAHNYALLSNLHVFRMLGKPLLAGISRKSMICKPLKVNPDKALNGTTALHMVALQQGASILRVHDVREAVETIKLFELL
jgi:dihydropteroate synthase